MPQRRAKYSRIFSGQRGQAGIAAIQHIADYWKTGAKQDDTDKIGQGDPRPESQKVLVRPFAFGADDTEANNPYAVNFFMIASGNKATFDKYKDLSLPGSLKVSDSFHVTKPLGTIISTADITPSRIVVVTGRSSKATSKRSKVTGLKYGSYGGKSTSFPFGVISTGQSFGTIPLLNTDIQTEETVFNAIKSAITAAAQGTPPLVTLKKEYVATPPTI